MTNQETNTYLAERLFGYEIVEQEDECEQLEYLWRKPVGHPSWCEYSYIKPIDYIANWHLVVEKLGKEITIDPPLEDFGWSVDILDGHVWFYGSGHYKTCGEAVCRAVVEYLKSKEEVGG